MTASSDGKDGAEKPPPPQWGKIYARLLYHTSMGYEEVANRTIPQIMAILAESGENIAVKIGMPGGALGGAADNIPPQPDGKPPKLSQFQEFAGMFNGI